VSEAFAEPFDAILELGGESLRKAMADDHGARNLRPGDDRSRRQAAAAAAGVRRRPWQRFARRPLSCRRRRRADPLGDARARRCARRRAVAARAGNDLCAGRPARRYLDRGPAVLECVCRAGEERGHRAAERALRRLFGARARRVDATRRRLAERCDARALPRALRDEDRAALRSGLRARRPRRWRPGSRPLRPCRRARVPDPRRRAGHHRAGGADRQATRCRPARRHGHVAADPRPRNVARARRARPSARCRHKPARISGGPWNCSPTAWCSATPRRRSEVERDDQIGFERLREVLDVGFHAGARDTRERALQLAHSTV